MPEQKIISLAALRAVLEERFPETAAAPAQVWKTGWAPLDAREGGIALGAVTEICSVGGGGRLFVDRVLAAVSHRQDHAGFIEVGWSFDPQSYCAAALQRVLDVFCATVEHGVKAADLLLRDGNLPLVLLDLQGVPRRQLGHIPANTWHRFQRLVERSGTALVVLTPQPIVEAARIRIVLRGRWELAALCRPREELLTHLEVQIFHRGRRAQFTPEPLVRTA